MAHFSSSAPLSAYFWPFNGVVRRIRGIIRRFGAAFWGLVCLLSFSLAGRSIKEIEQHYHRESLASGRFSRALCSPHFSPWQYIRKWATFIFILSWHLVVLIHLHNLSIPDPNSRADTFSTYLSTSKHVKAPQLRVPVFALSPTSLV